jgi:GrpB-like predicted nucleotidyltransferase (UPF0157 family)
MPKNAEIPKPEDSDLNRGQRISHRPRRVIEMVEPNPNWPSLFALIAQRIQAALGGRALAIDHVGSTSVPDLPAKDVIDINLVVADPTAEGDYVQDLEDAGFQFLYREMVITFSTRAFFLKVVNADPRRCSGMSIASLASMSRTPTSMYGAPTTPRLSVNAYLKSGCWITRMID